MRRRFSGNKQQGELLERYMAIETIEDVEIVIDERKIEYSYDGKNWKILPRYQYLKIKSNNLVFFKNIIPTYTEHGTIHITGKHNLKGNCLSLIFGDNAYGKTDIREYARCFYILFANNNVVMVDENFLPATILAFTCYGSMFMDCRNLIQAPKLPATELENYCYENMYDGCDNLTQAPELPATTLVVGCYRSMFRGCGKLNYIKMLATDISAMDCLYGWVYNVASSGTFVKHPDMVDLPNGINGIPNGWKVLNDGEEDSGGDGTYDEIFGNIPPESTEFGWPLYINVPFAELYDGGTIYYEKEADEIVKKLNDWAYENYTIVEEMFFMQSVEAYPPELYINGIKIEKIYGDFEFGELSGFWFMQPENWDINGYRIRDISFDDNILDISLSKL